MDSDIAQSPTGGAPPVVVIGAGIGGLSAALRLAAAGRRVHVIDRAAAPGGKMRRVDGVDAGPTVLTLKPVFDALFAAAGTRLEDHVTLVRQDVIARHFWPDGTRLDLFAERARSSAAIADVFGVAAASEFDCFARRAARLFDGFDAPMMQAPAPAPLGLAAHVLRTPSLLPAMAPVASLSARLARDFTDPKLRQLFGRYATYVGGLPHRVPALLSLIWTAEEAGVWAVRGGLSSLARALADRIEALGGTITLDTQVRRIETDRDGVAAVHLACGSRIATRCVVFNGDPRALATGRLGPDTAHVAPQTLKARRALSARVWAFRAKLDGPELCHHNVFFTADPDAEFRALDRGEDGGSPTLYLCAEDRGLGHAPPDLERVEIIVNAAPLTESRGPQEEFAACRTRTFETLASFGLTVSPTPGRTTLSTPSDFETLFPASAGSLYGQSPHGMMAAFRRPTARTPVPGLYLAGGGTHPGAGVPMAALSGKHAAETILKDRISPSRSRPAAMRGGMSTA